MDTRLGGRGHLDERGRRRGYVVDELIEAVVVVVFGAVAAEAVARKVLRGARRHEEPCDQVELGLKAWQRGDRDVPVAATPLGRQRVVHPRRRPEGDGEVGIVPAKERAIVGSGEA